MQLGVHTDQVGTTGVHTNRVLTDGVHTDGVHIQGLKLGNFLRSHDVSQTFSTIYPLLKYLYWLPFAKTIQHKFVILTIFYPKFAPNPHTPHFNTLNLLSRGTHINRSANIQTNSVDALIM